MMFSEFLKIILKINFQKQKPNNPYIHIYRSGVSNGINSRIMNQRMLKKFIMSYNITTTATPLYKQLSLPLGYAGISQTITDPKSKKPTGVP